RSRVAGRSRRTKVAHKTGRSATASTRSKRGSVVLIPPTYSHPPFPKTSPNTSEPSGTTEPVSEDWEALPAEYQPLRRLLEKCVVTQPRRRHSGFGSVLEAF